MTKNEKSGRTDVAAGKEKPVYDVLGLLKTEKLDTKPNVARFLKTYVESVRILIDGANVNLWPKISYDIVKCFVRFKDEQTLIKDFTIKNRFWLCLGLDALDLKESDRKRIAKFFDDLERFRFVRNGHEDVKVFSTDVSKTNAEMAKETSCVKPEKKIPEFFDYTPVISVSIHVGKDEDEKKPDQPSEGA